ncbi:uncharacterized protein LOC106058050 [Biomphalaria glabrata]|uniref:Uncharacterized protein LOC106058050 n=1 Tax=Biomphalaria glabrata TaxID=6526 RepID=A0A9W3A9F4_BIOGL|nr:uncharacterized protein LOC106058050 [Biomphalaria glabrata]XP_055883928.1 uncharacterized protein LOC106058050 [Biomphalaria glabrata]KAI8730968.1 hypothetical protein BgiMline_030593 [Biomphalaria glabrata]
MSCLYLQGTFCYIGLVPILFSLLSLVDGAKNYSVDLQGPGCDTVDGYFLKDKNDTAVVFSLPLSNAMPGRDRCEVLVKTDVTRKIQYVLESIKFNECGIDIYISDDKNTNHHFQCSNANIGPVFGKSTENYLRVRTRLATSGTRHFEFKMQLKNDLGPALYVEQTTIKATSSFSKLAANRQQIMILILITWFYV